MEKGSEQQDFQCLICNQLILKPTMLPCSHQFCCYCIRSIKYKNEDKNIVCPLCRRVSGWSPLNKKRELEVIKALLPRPKVRVFWGKGKTINDYDGNISQSRGFFYIMMGDKFIGDIIWGGGSEHDTYIQEVGRCSGKVTFLEGGDFAYAHDYGARYSNTPHEKWSGTFTLTGDRTYKLQHGRYLWNGWQHESSGILYMELKEIREGDDLKMYSTNIARIQAGAERDVECQKCLQVILNPVVLPCYHQVCAFCLRSKQGNNTVECPLCGVKAGKLAIDRDRERQILRQIIKRPNTRVFEGEASTINDNDKNLTHSENFFYILTNNYIRGDIIWGRGSVHNTYLGEVGRVTGCVTLRENDEFDFGVGFGAVYSNTPTEDWSGNFKKVGEKLILEKGKYLWHGWGRNSSGTLNMQLRQLKQQNL